MMTDHVSPGDRLMLPPIVAVVDQTGVDEALSVAQYRDNSAFAGIVTDFQDDVWPGAQYLVVRTLVPGDTQKSGVRYWACFTADQLEEAVDRALKQTGDGAIWFLCATDETAALLKPLDLRRSGSVI